jgi:phosphinothricin acetyltransferase
MASAAHIGDLGYGLVVTWTIRPVNEGDFAAIAEIVNAHIVGGVAHFADQPTTAADWSEDWQEARALFPWLVAERDGSLGGLAYAKRFNGRAAYDWTAEVSIYLREGVEGQGLGTVLYSWLIPTLDAQGYRCLIAGITTPNPASVRLHQKFGFEYLGTLNRVGYKHGRWLDVGSWQRHVGIGDDSPPGPILQVDQAHTDPV